MVALWNRADHYIFALWFLSCFFFFFLAYSQPSRIVCVPYFHTWCGFSPNLECRSEMYCTRLAGNAGHKKIAVWAPSHNFMGYILATKARIDNRKILVKQQISNISSTCPHNMVNFSLLAAEIVSLVRGHPS